MKFGENLSGNGSRNFNKYLLPNAEVMYRVAFRLCKTSQGAEDLVQETYFLALKNFHQLKDPERSKYWLFAILRNVFLKDIEKNRTGLKLNLTQFVTLFVIRPNLKMKSWKMSLRKPYELPWTSLMKSLENLLDCFILKAILIKIYPARLKYL